MQLTLDRFYKGPKYTIGKLYIDGEYFCDTIEDIDRGLKQTDSLNYIKATKVYAETAIPSGIYDVTLDIISPKFSLKDFYKKTCNGKVPRILNVPGFEGILIHAGTDQNSSAGCVIVGENKIVGKVINSQETFKRLYNKLKEEKDITIIIK